MSVINLPKKLDLATVGDVAQAIRDGSGDIKLDAMEMTSLGALGLQTLVAASRAAKARGSSFSMINSTDRIIEQMKVMGATPEMLEEGSL